LVAILHIPPHLLLHNKRLLNIYGYGNWGYDAEIVIPDEPASSLDAIAGDGNFYEVPGDYQGRSAVLISHRFSTELMADCIYVPESGLIVEQGSHTELMEQNGRYSTMFHVQAMPTGNHQADKLRVFCTGISDLLQDKRIHNIYIASGKDCN